MNALAFTESFTRALEEYCDPDLLSLKCQRGLQQSRQMLDELYQKATEATDTIMSYASDEASQGGLKREDTGEDSYNAHLAVDEPVVKFSKHIYLEVVNQVLSTAHQKHHGEETTMTSSENANLNHRRVEKNCGQDTNPERWMTISEAADCDDRGDFQYVGRQEHTNEDRRTISKAAEYASDSDDEEINANLKSLNELFKTSSEAAGYDSQEWDYEMVHNAFDTTEGKTIQRDATKPCGCAMTIMEVIRHSMWTVQGSAKSNDSWNLCERCRAYSKDLQFEGGDRGNDDDSMVMIDDEEASDDDGASVLSIPDDETDEGSGDVAVQTVREPIVPGDWW